MEGSLKRKNSIKSLIDDIEGEERGGGKEVKRKRIRKKGEHSYLWLKEEDYEEK